MHRFLRKFLSPVNLFRPANCNKINDKWKVHHKYITATKDLNDKIYAIGQTKTPSITN